MDDSKEKEIEITSYKNTYSPGEEVTVVLHESLGIKALFYGYLLPFVLVLITLIAIYAITGSEGAAGLIALGILIPYYTTLYFFRDYLKKVFKFELEETD